MIFSEGSTPLLCNIYRFHETNIYQGQCSIIPSPLKDQDAHRLQRTRIENVQGCGFKHFIAAPLWEKSLILWCADQGRKYTAAEVPVKVHSENSYS